MRVHHIRRDNVHDETFELLDDDGQAIPVVAGFLRHLRARGCSPNTLSAYAYDLLHFMTFLKKQQLTYLDFSPRHAFLFLEYLSILPSRKRAQRLSLVLSTTTEEGTSATRQNPIQQVDDPALARVAERHRPFMGRASHQRPIRRSVHVKTIRRVPRPMGDEQIGKLLASLSKKRDQAMLLLMLHGGLRPGEVLNLQLEDISYARRRVIIRYCTEHPKGARTKSRTERVVDLLQAETLQAVSDYVMHERPSEATSPYVFLVGGRGKRRAEPLSYAALVKLFERHCERLGLRTPWITPHALRHTHATRMFEGGMRDLTLQKRLGHASPESTRIYTDVSDATVVAEYRHALGKEETR